MLNNFWKIKFSELISGKGLWIFDRIELFRAIFKKAFYCKTQFLKSHLHQHSHTQLFLPSIKKS